MSAIIKKLGISPELRRELEVRDKAASGDIVFTLTPATAAKSATTAAWTRTVLVKLETAAGELHDWFSGDITLTTATSSTSGGITIPSGTLALVNGKANVTVTGTSGPWVRTETDTLTVSDTTVLGWAVATKSSVQTWTT